MPASIRPRTVHPISLRELEVLEAYDLTPGMRRVVLGGAELRAFRRAGFELPEFRSDGFDDELKVFLPDPESGELSLPRQLDRLIEWPREPRPVARTYTVRRYEPDTGRLTLDFVRHGSGPATSWAAAAEPGARVHIAGPKFGLGLPPDVAWILAVGDETALPAIGRLLEELPDGVRALVFVEIPDDADRQELPQRPGVELVWLPRNGREAGRTTMLLDAVRAAELPPGEGYAWVAGETVTLRELRRHLRDERGIAGDRLEVTGYWRRAELVAGGEPEDATVEDDERLHELTELVPGMALRVAATLGVVAAIRQGATTAEAIARRVGADAVALGRLLRYLAALEVLEPVGDGLDAANERYRVTPLGDELDDESEHLDLNDPAVRAQLAVVRLLEAVRSGTPQYEATFGRSLDTERDTDGTSDRAFRAAASAHLEWLEPSFADQPLFASGEHVVAAGDGAAALIAGQLRREPGLTASLLERPSRLDAALAVAPAELRSRLRPLAGSLYDGVPAGTDAVLLVGVVGALPDADAVHVLAAASRDADRVVLVEELLGIDGQLDEPEAEDDLLRLCTSGGAFRTSGELRALVELAGAEIVEDRAIGWGDRLITVRASAAA